jgi:sugar phosphate isomerase/epimerase
LRKAAMNTAAAGILSAGAMELRANPLGMPIGSQTWNHRQRIKDGDFAGLCKDMAAIGITSMELCSPAYADFKILSDGKQVKKVLDDHGIKCPSGHFEMNELRTRQSQAIQWAHEIGMTQMGTASLGAPVGHGAAGFAGMDKDSVPLDLVKQAAEEYNKIGQAAARAGIRQFLHNEGFEQSKTEGGRLTYQVLLELLDPKAVNMQFQMSTMRAVGDPVEYFKKYPGRFISLHLQGVDLSAPAQYTGAARPAPQLAVGKDSVDWAKVFAAAKGGGVKNYFIEQTWDLTVQSAAYLKALKV